MSTSPQPINAVVFDLGGVLVDWDRRHLYRKLFDDPDEMEEFLATVCTMEWNDQLDKGKPFAEAVLELAAEHPQHAPLIEAYHARWIEMVSGVMEDTVALVRELHSRAVPLFALSNWSHETFELVRHEYDFLECFDGVLLSSEIGITKPDRRIFDEMVNRHGLEPARTLFIDDNPPNVEGARAAGWQAVRFTSATTLREDLAGLGLLGRD